MLDAFYCRGVAVTPEAARKAFNYNPETGALTWRREETRSDRWNTRYAGSEFGASRPDGYRRGQAFGEFYYAHRLIWLIVYGEAPETIDHINGDRSDNRIINLRAATNSENLMNRGRQANNSSGFKGVYYSRTARKFAAQIKANGRARYLGLYETADDAGAAYRAAAEHVHGAFANIG